MKEKLLKIIWHYGLMSQLKYFQSEVFELNEAIIKYFNDKNFDENFCDIKEEIADVMVMLEQFKHYFGLNDEDIKEIMQQKIDRQLKRIEEDK